MLVENPKTPPQAPPPPPPPPDTCSYRAVPMAVSQSRANWRVAFEAESAFPCPPVWAPPRARNSSVVPQVRLRPAPSEKRVDVGKFQKPPPYAGGVRRAVPKRNLWRSSVSPSSSGRAVPKVQLRLKRAVVRLNVAELKRVKIEREPQRSVGSAALQAVVLGRL